MNRYLHLFCFLLMATVVVCGCKKPYMPSVINDAPSILVVEGNINGTAGGETRILLSRTSKLTDEVIYNPVERAQVQIEQEGGAQWWLREETPGQYKSDPLNLSGGSRYRLRIQTATGEAYESDYVPMLQSPPIDSVTWSIGGDTLDIFVHAHDPANKTRYYRWEFEETYEFYGRYQSQMEWRNGSMYFREPHEYQNICWRTLFSKSIILGTSTKLSEDVISRQPVTSVLRDDEKLDVKYSILVRQYALDRPAYEFWQILQKTTENQKGLFDMQPAELPTNYRSLSGPQQLVIGYLSASSTTEKRIFIRSDESMSTYIDKMDCEERIIHRDSIGHWLNPPSIYGPAYFITGGGLAIARRECVDCTERGGTIVKPAFWQ